MAGHVQHHRAATGPTAPMRPTGRVPQPDDDAGAAGAEGLERDQEQEQEQEQGQEMVETAASGAMSAQLGHGERKQ